MKVPQRPLQFLRWFCRSDRLEEVEGDLIEVFEKSSERFSPSRAKWLFFLNVLRAMHPYNLRRRSVSRTTLFRNYVKVGLRNMTRDIRFTLINLAGLSVGLSVFVVMMLMVQHEMTFDNFHRKGGRIYQVIQEFIGPQGLDPEIYTAFPLAEALRTDLPMVQNAVTLHGASSTWVTANDKRFFEEDGIVAGPQFFEMFDFPLIVGDPKKVLKQKRSMVVGKALALKYFGHIDVVGEVVDLENYGLFVISGVMDLLPSNSTMQFDFIISQDYDVFLTLVSEGFRSYFMSWEGDPVATFVMLNDPMDAPLFEREVEEKVLARHLPDAKDYNRHYLINLHDLHFGLEAVDGQVNRYVDGNMKQLRIFVVIACCILLMACFNYINVTTARSIRRTKEVGIRKSVGAHKGQISVQFLTESLLMIAFAIVLSLGIVYLTLPFFTAVTGIGLTLSWQSLTHIVPYLVITVLVVTVLAGFYPAIYLSRFGTITVLKGAHTSNKSNVPLRNVLLTFQFMLVIAMLGWLVTIHQQYSYLLNQPLGFDSEELVIVEINGPGVRANYEQIKRELLSQPEVAAVTGLTRMISGYRGSTNLYVGETEDRDISWRMRFYGMDEDGLSTLNIPLLYGENLSGNYGIDSASVLINETGAEKFGGSGVLGKYIYLSDDDETLRAKVIGIVRDFHYESLHDAIGPVVIGHYRNTFQSIDDIVIRLAGKERQSALELIERIHNKYDENDVMTWEFMDEMLQRAYENEIVFKKILSASTLICILICLLGIIGMVSYNILNRTKEFGIRKVMGATTIQLLFLHGKHLLALVVIASVFSIPAGWILASRWLQGYAYRIAPDPLKFMMVVLVVLGIAAFTIIALGLRSARENPVKALRYE